MSKIDDILKEHAVSLANYTDVLMEYENTLAQGLQIYYNTLRSEFGQKYPYVAMVEAFYFMIGKFGGQYFDISEIKTLLKTLMNKINARESAGISTDYLSDIMIEINSNDEMITLLRQVAQKRRYNKELTESDERMEEIYTERIQESLKIEMNRYRPSHESVLKFMKDYIPQERLAWWVEQDLISQFISDAGKIFHDLAVIFTSLMEYKPELLNLQDAITALYSKVREYMNDPPDNTSIYLSGSALNIQARTGHSIKVRIDVNTTELYGHIGDYSYLQNIDNTISNKGDNHEYAENVFKAIDIIANAVSLEQRIRNNLMGEFDVILEELYSIELIKDIEREAGTHTDTTSLYNELDRVLTRLVNLFKRQLLLFNQLNSILDEPVELLSPVEIIINDQHFRHRIHTIEGFVSYMKEMFKGT